MSDNITKITNFEFIKLEFLKLKKENESLRAENERLRNEIIRLKSDLFIAGKVIERTNIYLKKNHPGWKSEVIEAEND